MAIDLNASLVEADPAEDLDPMASLANMVDVMLVFACGLMMALVVAWNVDISSVVETTPIDKLSEVDNIEELQEQLTSEGGNAYVDMGSVYMDPDTGKYYMVTSEDAERTAAAVGHGGQSSNAAGTSGAGE